MDEMVKRSREKIPYRYLSGISMTEAAASPSSFPEHWHMSAEFIVAKTDDCLFRVSEKEYRLQKGDVLLIWPTQLHQTVRAPKNSHLILQFSSELLSSCDDFNICYYDLQRLHLFDQSYADVCAYIRKKIEECLELYLLQAPFSETKIRLRIYEILLYLCETQLSAVSRQPLPTEKGYDTYIRIQNACKYIRQNCREDISQTEVAEMAGFSQYYFSRVFKEYTQESFSEYLSRQRILNAITLLHQDQITITDVSFLSGFQSISNFNKVFRNLMHCSPMQYRKKHQEIGNQTG
ncbi:MAG: helix-turn-helix transcriptional regulator [Blautia sp.]|nr:helix-turn-helix transcriptional regulator [Blautia sp.]